MSDIAERRIALFESQWHALSGWLRALDLEGALPLERRSALEGWTIAELITHLGRGLGTVLSAYPGGPDIEPKTLAQYVSVYPAVAEETAEAARALERQVGETRLDANDRTAVEAFAALPGLRDSEVVVAMRGPLTFEDFLTTRLLELVVHGDDLARSIPDAGPAPLDPEAVEAVAEALAAIASERLGGAGIVIASPLAWVRLGAGRVAFDEAAAEAIRLPGGAGTTAEELASVLPLL